MGESTSSFYVTLRSSGSGSITRNDVGTVYRTYLQKEMLLFENDWQVALTNFHYVGQKWGNLSPYERSIAIQYYGPKLVEFVATCVTIKNKDNFYIRAGRGESITLTLTNYTFEALKEKIEDMYQSAVDFLGVKSSLRFVSDREMIFTKLPSATPFNVEISEALANVIGIKKNRTFLFVENVHSTSLECKRPPIVALGYYKFTVKGYQQFYINLTNGFPLTTTRFNIPNGEWTLEMLAAYLINKDIQHYFKVKVKNVVEYNGLDLQTEYHGTIVFENLYGDENFKIEFSDAFKAKLFLSTMDILLFHRKTFVAPFLKQVNPNTLEVNSHLPIDLS